MTLRVKGAVAAALCVVGVAAGISLGSGSALADPDQAPVDPAVVDAPPAQVPPPDPAIPAPPPDPGDLASARARRSAGCAAGNRSAAAAAAAAAAGPVKGQNPLPYTGDPVFAPPSFNPVNGAMVGVAKPIIINFARPIANRPLAEQAIHISSVPPVPGAFYWLTDTQVRWRPYSFWPAGTVVNIDASGAKSSFRVGDALVATADNATHQMTITRNGKVEKTFPMSMGKPGSRHPERHLLRAGEVPGHRDGLGHLRRAEHIARRLQGSRPARRADRQPGQLRAQRAVVGGRPGQAQRQPRLHQPLAGQCASGSTTTSAAATRSS